MEEAAEADYIVILDKGKICAEGTPLALKNAYAKDYVALYGVAEEDVGERDRLLVSCEGHAAVDGLDAVVAERVDLLAQEALQPKQAGGNKL